MKRHFLIIASFFALSLTSCKDEKKSDAVSAPKVETKNNFGIELDVASAKKDDFAVYYTEDGSTNFDGKLAIWTGIAGGKPTEKLIFDIPESALPTDIRMDFGLNKDQDFVEIQHVKMTYMSQNFEFKGSEFFTYFIKDDNFKTEIDNAKGTMKITKKDKEYKTPFFYPRQELIDAIKKMTYPSK